MILGDAGCAGGRVEIKIEVDTVAAMKGKGQYIYVRLAQSEAALDLDERPVLMFNNGYDGGTSAELNKYSTHEGGVFAGVWREQIRPALLKLL